jgi:uncharacterized protein (TIGR02265 family)
VQHFDRDFVEPPWSAPLDVTACLRGIPESAQVTGMFLEPLAEAARAAGKPLPSARDRYVAFRFYPMAEHAQLLVEASTRLFSDRSMRQALRAFGRGAPDALISSTIGKVMLGSAVGPEEALRAISKAYTLNLKPSRAEVVEVLPGCAIVRLEEVYYFLDSHHVGIFEGVLRFANASNPRVTICMHSAREADLRCSWDR